MGWLPRRTNWWWILLHGALTIVFVIALWRDLAAPVRRKGMGPIDPVTGLRPYPSNLDRTLDVILLGGGAGLFAALTIYECVLIRRQQAK